MKNLIILLTLILYFCSYRVIYRGSESWDNTVIEYNQEIKSKTDILRIEKQIKEEWGEGRIPDKIVLVYILKLGDL